MSQYNYENDIHERRKYWEEWTTQICSQWSDTVDNKGIKNTTFDTIKTKVKKNPDETTLIHINWHK